jgi:hypothetical protein
VFVNCRLTRFAVVARPAMVVDMHLASLDLPGLNSRSLAGMGVIVWRIGLRWLVGACAGWGLTETRMVKMALPPAHST